VGAFALVFAGCGAIMVDAKTGGALGQIGIALCFGLAITAMVYAVGHISGQLLRGETEAEGAGARGDAPGAS
jgi:glycerol uptake facilitator-like aquaporin